MQLQAFTQVFDGRLRERNFSQAVTLCDQALSTRLTPPQRCRILQLKAEALLAGGRDFEGPALGCLRDAYSTTRPDSLDRGRTLTALTAAYASLASLARCQEARDELALIVAKRRAPAIARLLPHAEFNLAVILHERDEIEAAEERYLAALSACSRHTDAVTSYLKAKIQHNLIDIFQELDRHDHAHVIMENVFPKLDEAVFGAQIRNRWAIHALSQGDVPSAILWAESGLGHSSCDNKTRAALTLTKARIAHATGSKDEARGYALEARRLAKEAECNRLASRAQRFLDQVPKGV